MANTARMMTGIKPTGDLHLGNLLGAIRPFTSASAARETVFGVMDLHALTVHHEPAQVHLLTMQVFRLLLACGVNADTQAVLFVQSQVPAHTEMAYLVECVARVGEMTRMIAYKEKAQLAGEDGLRFSIMSYPALMSADILVYRATHVPVGEDQRQHLELTRTVANRFNRTYGPTLMVPQAEVTPHVARVMDLQNPTSKMGKSNESAQGTLFVLDSESVVRRKIGRAVTDQDEIVRFDPTAKPGVSNLLSIYAALTGGDPIVQANEFASYVALKTAVADVIVATLAPIRQAYDGLDPDQVRAIMRAGAVQAQAMAAPVVYETKKALGLVV